MSARLVLATHARAAELARRRAIALGALRGVLAERGCVEVDPPGLLPCAGQEPHLQPPRVDVPGLPGPLWLQTSPELSCKRLLAAGLDALYALGPAWRGGREELSAHHQPAFAMLEWYRPARGLAALHADVRDLVRAVADALGRPVPVEGRALTVSEAIEVHAALDPAPLFDGELERFAASARAAGLERARAEDGVEGLLGRVLVERIEPALAAQGGLVFLSRYPAGCAALAELDPADPRMALRTEAYLHGLELANGYQELLDPVELAARWDAEAAARDPVHDEPAPPRDDALLGALAARTLPATVGMALGVDRLLLALEGGKDLSEVLPLHLRLEPNDGAPDSA